MPTQAGGGARRSRKVRGAVKAAEVLSRLFITTGGIGTIVAVAGICLFLVWVAAPLFFGASIDEAGEVEMVDVEAPARWMVDEHRLLSAIVEPGGHVRVLELATGRELERHALFEGRTPTSMSFDPNGSSCAFGFADGRVALAEIGFFVEFLGDDEEAAGGTELARLAPGEATAWRDGVVERTPEGQLRISRFRFAPGEALQVDPPAPVALVDYAPSTARTAAAALTADGRLTVFRLRTKRNLLTREVTTVVTPTEVPLDRDELAARGLPAHLLVTEGCDSIFLAWEDGALQRFDARLGSEPALAEEHDLADGQAELTALAFLLGRSTFVTGDSTGRVRAWFGTKPTAGDAGTPDGVRLVAAHELAQYGAPVTAFGPSPRSRLLSVGYDDGRVRMFHVTSHKLLSDVEVAGGVDRVLIAPKEDALAALSGSTLASWDVDPGYPEATLSALFRPVWYEGYEAPEHAWQSSSGTDDFEEKLGLWPLVFGTIKATTYTMVFAIPLALLAAIYTSEFMAGRTRNVVKSSIEMMASLPSVVLGFVAALIIAPYVQEVVPAVLVAFFSVPLAILLFAYAWQALPSSFTLSRGSLRIPLALLGLLVGVGLAATFGPVAERVLFAGDLMAWLDGQVGTSVGGWMLFLTPLSLVACALVAGRVVNPWMRARSVEWSRATCAGADFAKFVLLLFAGGVLALSTSFLLDRLGFDPRGSLVSTYEQKNSLIVGFVMGFAVIPIIYTIAEDALSSVPQHLRLASLGAGATPWQTAVRVVIPTAMSGLFSAIMIGLGRAVGETMIVLMATGNTAVREWNVFNGFRTLSANIATELPEAVRNSTHYRTLFLAALCLFVMTFVLNTFAETVRLRFRKRAFEL